MVGRNAIHVLGLLRDATKEISSADDDCRLNPEFLDITKLGGNLVDAGRVHAEALVCRQGLSRDFEQNTFKGRSCSHLVAPAFHRLCGGVWPTQYSIN